MKKIRTITLTFATLIIFGCNKNEPLGDETPPVITVKGESNMDAAFGIAAADPGATAVDDLDGDISAKLTSDWSAVVDVNSLGSQIVTYRAKDRNSNQSSATRTVNVKYRALSLVGEYSTYYTNVGFTTSPVFTSTVSLGAGAQQVFIYPFLSAFTLTAGISGEQGELFDYDQIDQADLTIGTGTVLNQGKTIMLNFMRYTTAGTLTMTQTMTRK